MSKTTTKAKAASNPFQQTWRTPNGLPPFANISAKHYWPAFKQALAEHKAEIAAIGANEKKPSFQNTIVALEKSGEALNKVADVFFNLASSDTSAELQEIERKLAPVLAQHWNAIQLDQKLFRRIEDLYERRESLKLDDEQARLLERTYTTFVRAGARLSAKARKRVAEINTRLAELVTQFGQNVLADEQSWRLALDDEADLAGLPQGVRDAAARTAADLKSPAKYVITLARSSIEPFLQFSARRDLREEAFKAWIKRGENGGKTDNRKIVAEIVKLQGGTGEADGLSHVRGIQPRRHDGEDAGCGARASQSGVVGGGEARRRRTRGAVGVGAQGGRELRPRGVGLAVSGGEGAQGALRSR